MPYRDPRREPGGAMTPVVCSFVAASVAAGAPDTGRTTCSAAPVPWAAIWTEPAEEGAARVKLVVSVRTPHLERGSYDGGSRSASQ
jgi:hypothetical protein